MNRLEELKSMSNDELDLLIAETIELNTGNKVSEGSPEKYSSQYSRIMPLFIKYGMSLHPAHYGGRYMARMWDGQHDAGVDSVCPIRTICYTFILCSEERDKCYTKQA